MIFQIFRQGSPAKWVVLVQGQPYGEYLDKEEAMLDAIEAAEEASQAGRSAEVWDGTVQVY
jgi:hypothetical protein